MNRIKKRTRLGLFLLMAAGLAGCGGGGNDGSGGGGSGSRPPQPGIRDALVSLSPKTKTVAVGATVTQTIDATAMENAYYTAFDVTYDPQILKHVGQLEGDFLTGTGRHASSSLFQVALENGVPGRLKIGVTRLGTTTGISGHGTLAVLTFEAVGRGTTTLAFDSPKGIRTFDDEEVPVLGWKPATVTVQ